ncbi:hypothetical protein AX14_000794 [Amanita brunnescens Koide BX004]|nr:hypothetical protein AX14_000794 [Amanita brunnescens Koide BX004]
MAFFPQTPQFPSPQMPYHAAFSFQPQSTWGGLDYYRAHALNAEPSLYEDAWGRVRDRSSIVNDSFGVGREEARHCHRRAYEIPGEIHRMSPVEIGHAAAYEAYNTWLQNSTMYEIVGEDRERQREGLVGIAVAEVTRLLQYSHRQADRYSQSTAADAAAHTVTVLFYQGQDDYPRSRSRMRAGSFAGSQMLDDDLLPRSRSRMRAASFAGSQMLDDDLLPRLSRTPSRSRSRSHHRHYSASPSRHRSRSRSYRDYPPMGGIPPPMGYSSSYGGYPSSQSNYNAPYATAQSMPITYPSQPIGMGMGTSYQPSLYSAPGTVVTVPRQNSVGYPMSYQSYPGASWSTTATAGVPVQQQPTVIIMDRKHRHHRHK